MEEFIEQEDEEIVLKLRDELLYMKKKDAWEEGVRISCEARKSYVVVRRNERPSCNLLVLLQRKRRDLFTPFSFEICSFNSVLFFWSAFIYAFEICPLDITSPFCVTFYM